MSKKELLVIANYSEESLLTLEELCGICGIHVAVVHDFMMHDIIRPIDGAEAQLIFDLEQLHRMQQALRLQHDLEVNVAGVALVLDLLEEVKRLRHQTEWLEKHFSK